MMCNTGKTAEGYVCNLDNWGCIIVMVPKFVFGMISGEWCDKGPLANLMEGNFQDDLSKVSNFIDPDDN